MHGAREATGSTHVSSSLSGATVRNSPRVYNAPDDRRCHVAIHEVAVEKLGQAAAAALRGGGAELLAAPELLLVWQG